MTIPNGDSPRVLGSGLVVKDSAELAQLDATGCTEGTFVFNRALQAYFEYAITSEALVPDEVVAVNGIEGARWVLSTIGDGGLWETLATQYASPLGDDAHAGSGWTSAKKTLYAATQAVVAAGGGTVYFAQDTTYGGPVSGQGLWLRGDSVTVPGFIQLNGAAVRFVGLGGNNNQFVFEPAGTVAPLPIANSQFSPQIWVTASQIPVEFERTKIYSGDFVGLTTPVRLGWDYARKTDFSLQFLNVTSASRVPGSPDQTTYTLDMSGANVWTVAQAQRVVDPVQTSGFRVDLWVTRPLTLACGEWSANSIAHFVSTDAGFPSGNYAVERSNDSLPLNPSVTQILLSWDDGQTTPIALRPVVSATLITNGCTPGDKVSTVFTDPNFQTACMYTVSAVPAYNQITVNDPYGYISGGSTVSGSNIGKLVKQNRGKAPIASAVKFSNSSVSGFLSQSGLDVPTVGPALDFGGSSASGLYLDNCYFTGGCVFSGMNTANPNHIDRDRTGVAVLGNPGGNSPNSATIFASNCKSQDGSLRWIGSPNGGQLLVNQWLQDSGGSAFPTLSIVKPGISDLFLDQIALADVASIDAIEIIGNTDPGRTRIGQVIGTITGAGMIGPQLPFSTYASGVLPNPWKTGRLCFWPGGLAARTAGPSRAMGVLGARFANLAGPPSGWTGSGMSFSSVSAPDGTNTATRITASPGGLVTCQTSTAGTFAAGDRVVIGAWIKLPVSAAQNQLQFFAPGSMTFDGNLSNAVIGTPMNFDGWQWVQGSASVASAGDQHFQCRINVVAGVTDVWGLTAVTVPVAIPDADAWELIGTLKHQPYYLHAGMSGTMEGQKLIAHGGLGTGPTARYTVGVASGNITLGAATGKAVELFDEAGNSLGVVAPLSFTVNP